MKRKTFCRRLFATALLVSAISLSNVVWADEINAPDNTQTQTTLDTQPTASEDTQTQPVTETKPEEPETQTPQNTVDMPYMVTPTMEISKEKDTYQSYEIIYVALTAPKGYAIYYSLDGSQATTESTRYTQPFAIEAPGAQGGSVTLHAIAVQSSDTM